MKVKMKKHFKKVTGSPKNQCKAPYNVWLFWAASRVLNSIIGFAGPRDGQVNDKFSCQPFCETLELLFAKTL